MTTEPVSEGVARGNVLAREVGEFLIEFAIALQKHAIYPEGHPALGRVSGRVLERLNALLQQRGSLSLGVARTQLVIEGIATDASHPVLRQLAFRFHEHHLAALRLDRGAEEWELRELLLAIAPDPGIGRAEPIGLKDQLPTWPHIHLSTLGLGDLDIVESDTGEGGSLVSRLWLDLARAALAGERDVSAGDDDELSPSVVARAIDRRSGSGTYDQVIAGYLIEITQSVRSGELTQAAPLTERVARLVRELSPETLERLMSHGGDRAQQRMFMQSAATGLPVDAVVRLLSATADAGGQPVSEQLLRMYEKLAVHAERDPPPVAARAEGELRSHIRMLVEGWQLDDPSPERYARALSGMARTQSVAGPDAAVTEIEDDRLLKMSLELGTGSEVLAHCLDRIVAAGRTAAALEVIDAAEPSRATAAALAHLGQVDRLPDLLNEAGLEAERLVPLVERMGGEGVAALLELLLESEDRGVRRRSFDVLAALGPVVAAAVDARFEGETRWFALRNLLALHDAIGTEPAVVLDGYAAHEDGRVRREALKLLLRDADRRGEILLRVLHDAEPRVVQLARTAGAAVLPPAALPLLERRIGDESLDEPLRAALVRMLGDMPQAGARDLLISLAVRGRTLLGQPRFEPPTAVSLAALTALAEHWPRDAAAATLLARARKARDPLVRDATDASRKP